MASCRYAAFTGTRVPPAPMPSGRRGAACKIACGFTSLTLTEEPIERRAADAAAVGPSSCAASRRAVLVAAGAAPLAAWLSGRQAAQAAGAEMGRSWRHPEATGRRSGLWPRRQLARLSPFLTIPTPSWPQPYPPHAQAHVPHPHTSTHTHPPKRRGGAGRCCWPLDLLSRLCQPGAGLPPARAGDVGAGEVWRTGGWVGGGDNHETRCLG